MFSIFNDEMRQRNDKTDVTMYASDASNSAKFRVNSITSYRCSHDVVQVNGIKSAGCSGNGRKGSYYEFIL